MRRHEKKVSLSIQSRLLKYDLQKIIDASRFSSRKSQY